MKDLGRLYRRFVGETIALLECFNNAHRAACPVLVQEMSAIKLHDAWARFCRELIIASSYAQPYSMNGQRVPRVPGIHSRDDALRRVMHNRRFEPRWADANQSIKAAQRLGVCNFANIAAGIGLTPSPLEELRRVRNFFAHRNARTAQDVRAIAQKMGLPTQPIDLMNYLQPPSGITLFESWVIQLQQMALIAVQYP